MLIVEHRVLADQSTQYRVRWEKQGPELDSWLFEKDFIDFGPLQSYSKAQGIDLRTKKVKSTREAKTVELPNMQVDQEVNLLDNVSTRLVVSPFYSAESRI
jgi:hypothetical protein